MKAITYDEYGGTEKLTYRDVKRPELKEDEVLIKIHAVAVNDFDLGMLMGNPYLLRPQYGLLKPKRIHILGSDIAGEVNAVGVSVTRFKVGDRVFGDLSDRWGGFAEYCCTKEDEIELMSETLSYESAAALPQAGALAYQGLFDYGKVQHGEKVLINGAGGGVGTLGIQMAKEEGVLVDGVDTVAKFDVMKALGFEEVIDYKSTDFISQGKKYDVVLDNKMTRSIFQCLKVLKAGGRYLIVGGNSWRLLQVVITAPFINLLTDKYVSLVMLKKNRGLDYMMKLHASGKLKVIMEEPVPLEKGIDAIKAYAENEFIGKVIIVNEKDL